MVSTDLMLRTKPSDGVHMLMAYACENIFNLHGPRFDRLCAWMRYIFKSCGIHGKCRGMRRARTSETLHSRFYTPIRLTHGSRSQVQHLIAAFEGGADGGAKYTQLLFSSTPGGCAIEVLDIHHVCRIRFLCWVGLQLLATYPPALLDVWCNHIVPLCRSLAVEYVPEFVRQKYAPIGRPCKRKIDTV